MSKQLKRFPPRPEDQLGVLPAARARIPPAARSTLAPADRPARRRANEAAAPRVPVRLDHGMLPDLIGYQLRLAQLSVFRDFERSVGALGISPGRVGVLVLIEANPGLAQSRLAEAVGLDRSTLVPLLDQFEALGYVERRPGPDRRTNGLWITATGERYLSKVKSEVSAHETRMLAPFSDAERATLFALLARLAA